MDTSLSQERLTEDMSPDLIERELEPVEDPSAEPEGEPKGYIQQLKEAYDNLMSNFSSGGNAFGGFGPNEKVDYQEGTAASTNSK